jgi:hypothetical protein
MIDVKAVLQEVPLHQSFCSLEELQGLLDRLRQDSRFQVLVAGHSAGGAPIHHVCFGRGSIQAMIVGFPHPMEPIGGLTVFNLLTLLEKGHSSLTDVGVEWHIVPCADPDGARLNEVWTQDFSIDKFFGNYYMPTMRDQAAMSFPIEHKKLVWNSPSREARVLMDLVQQVRPDLYFTLHNTRAGGLFVGLTHDIGQKHRASIEQLLKELHFKFQKRAPYKELCRSFSEGVSEHIFMRNFYDYLEKFTPFPEENRILRDGANEWDYLAEISPKSQCMIAEMGCIRHPFDESEKLTAFNLRGLKLHIDANSKYLASVLADEWDNVKSDVDCRSPFYRAVTGYILPTRQKIAEGGWPLSRYPTAEILVDSTNNRPATQGEVFNVCVMEGGLYYVQYASPFLRLLNKSRQIPAVAKSLERTEKAFSEARVEINRYIDVDAFQPFDFNTLAKVQLGCGLIVLNSILERGKAARPELVARK